MPRSYSPEFRKKVLDLIDTGRTVAEVVADLGVTGQTIYNWRNQHLIDTGQRVGVTSTDHVELLAARKRIAALEADLAASQRAVEPERLRTRCTARSCSTRGLAAVAATLNSQPRKTLGWRTPAEAVDEHLRSLQQSSVASID